MVNIKIIIVITIALLINMYLQSKVDKWMVNKHRKNLLARFKKNEEIEAVKKNTEKVREVDADLRELLDETIALRDGVNTSFTNSLDVYGNDYTSFSEAQKKSLGALVNNTKALAALLGKVIQ